MPLFHLGPAGDAFVGVFGGTAALLLVGGPVLLRWQRSRQQFQLAQSAISQGVTRFPRGTPLWLASLRQGVLSLALGVALLIVGGVATWFTSNTRMTVSAVSTGASATVATKSASPTLISPDTEPALPGSARLGPPRPDPAMEEFHRVQSINSLGLMSLATGFVLLLLGVVRIAFAKVEQHYEPKDDHAV